VALAHRSEGAVPPPTDVALKLESGDRPAGKSASVRDVARLANVSPATVSLVINRNPRITPATQERVRQAMQQVGYRSGRQVAKESPPAVQAIAVLLPSLSHALADRYFGELISGICDRAHTLDSRVLLEHATPDMIQGRRHLELFERRFVDGVLCLGNSDRHPFLTDFAAAHYPMLVVNNYFPQWDLDHVVCDYRAGAAQAMDYLLQLGHRRIGMISGSTWVRTARDVVEMHEAKLRQAGGDPPSSWREDGLYTEEGGAAAARKLFERHPDLTALFAGNDKMAVGAMHWLAESGRRVPQDVSVVGFDDMAPGLVRPPLTTVHTPLYQVGVLACEQLFARIGGQASKVQSVVATHLVVRGSSGIAPVARR
jgi:LacI family transcriptional regulator